MGEAAGRSPEADTRGAPRGLGPPAVGPGSCGMEGGQGGRQTSSGLLRRWALPSDPNTHDSLEESTDRPPLFGSPAAPPPPRDRGAVPKLRVPLCPRARAHTHTHSHLPTLRVRRCPRAFLNPEISHCSRIRRPVTCSQHPDPPPWLPESLQTPRASCAPSCKPLPHARSVAKPGTPPGASPKPVPWGSALQVPSTPPSSSWLPRRTAAR